ncbi:helix-turn-helix domain-containing protein [Nocardia sp. NPDC004068]|uniref:helix-turn-helix domain-containing protein n=1 Tax=Nocardia sp. NPDC004068 TaxID=3364303 RepID=UPI00369A5FF0
MGAVVRAYRHHAAHGHRPLSQAEVARHLGISQGQLSRIENGRSKIRDLDTLSRYARQLNIPSALLWFDVDEDQPPSAMIAGTPVEQIRLPGGDAVPAASALIEQPLVDSLLASLEQYAATDMMKGPHLLIPVVEQQMIFIDQVMIGSRGRTRERLLYVSARYAEFMGWLQQDAGDLSSAMSWSNAALELAEGRGDVHLLSYLRMRKSNIASDARKPEVATVFARAALTNSSSLPPRLRAVALRQLAHGYALTGDRDACARSLDQAHAFAAAPGDRLPVDMAAYCTTGYIAMEAAHCWVELGRPAAALEVLRAGLSDWKPGNRRDLGVGLARLAVTHASLAQADEALEVAGHSLTILADTRSNRIARQLRRGIEELARAGLAGYARELDRKLQRTLRTPLPTARRNEWT